MRILTMLATVLALQGGAQIPQPQKATAPTVRIYNATRSEKGTKLDIVIDGAPVASAVEPNVLSGPFKPKDPANAAFTVKKAGDTMSLLDQPIALAGKDHILVLTGDPDQKVDVADLSVPAAAGDGQALIGLLNAIPKETIADNIDIYLLKANDTLDTAQPVAKGVDVRATVATGLAPGSYKIVLTKSGDKAALLESESFDVAADERKAAFAIAGGAGKPNQIVVLTL